MGARKFCKWLMSMSSCLITESECVMATTWEPASRLFELSRVTAGSGLARPHARTNFCGAGFSGELSLSFTLAELGLSTASAAAVATGAYRW